MSIYDSSNSLPTSTKSLPHVNWWLVSGSTCSNDITGCHVAILIFQESSFGNIATTIRSSMWHDLVHFFYLDLAGSMYYHLFLYDLSAGSTSSDYVSMFVQFFFPSKSDRLGSTMQACASKRTCVFKKIMLWVV